MRAKSLRFKCLQQSNGRLDLWRQYAVGFLTNPGRIRVSGQPVTYFPAIVSDRSLPGGKGPGGAGREVALSAGLLVQDDVGGASRRALRVLAFADELSKRLR